MSTTEHATHHLVLQHLPLVGYHVNSVLSRVPAHVQRADLASAGQLALVQAARSFDPSTGVPFTRWAGLRIRGALLDELRGMDWASRAARRRLRDVKTVTDQLAATLGRAPAREEIAETMGITVQDVEAARADANVRVLSSDAYDGQLADILIDTAPGPEEALLAKERLQYLRGAIAALPDRLRQVIEGLYFEDRTIQDLADERDVTASRISQVRAEALSLLRDGMNAHLNPDLVPEADLPNGTADRRRQAYFARVAAHAAEVGLASTAAMLPTQRPSTSDPRLEDLVA